MKVTQEWSQWASFDSKSCLHNQGNHVIKKRSWKTHALINTLKTNDSAKWITYKNWSTLRLPRVDGISPVKLLFAKSKFSKLVRFPNSLGISPVMWFPGNTLHDKWNQYKLGLHLKENCSNICQWLENITTHKFPFKQPSCQGTTIEKKCMNTDDAIMATSSTTSTSNYEKLTLDRSQYDKNPFQVYYYYSFLRYCSKVLLHSKDTYLSNLRKDNSNNIFVWETKTNKSFNSIKLDKKS